MDNTYAQRLVKTNDVVVPAETQSGVSVGWYIARLTPRQSGNMPRSTHDASMYVSDRSWAMLVGSVNSELCETCSSLSDRSCQKLFSSSGIVYWVYL